MDNVVYLDYKAKELENLKSGNNKMIIRGAMGRKLPYGCVNKSDILYFIENNGNGLVKGKAIVDNVFNSNKLTKEQSIEIVEKHQDKLILNKGLEKRFAGKRYLVLITIKDFEEIEPFKIDRTDIEDKIILYDLTNTYFEGRKAGSKIAKFGRSKEKRSDARLVALALVTNPEGFTKHSKIYRGNISDPATLKQMVGNLSASTSTADRKPIVVIDAGIATKGNLEMLKSEGYEYLCVTRSKLKDYKLNTEGQGIVKLQDKKGNKIEVCQIDKPESSDKYLYVKSAQKAVKEASMDDHFSQRFEEELNNAHESLHKPRGTKKIEKVWRRIGRIQERYPSANKHYEIKVTEADGKATSITFSRKQLHPKKYHGVYFLRTNVEGLGEEQFWKIYNTLTEIEASFRILKTDLKLRPVFHKEDVHTEAHIFLGILAYALVNTIRYQLKQKGIKHDWGNIVRIMNTQKVLTTTMNTYKAGKLVIRSTSKPSVACNEIYEALNYGPRPFYRKNIVLPE